jgi:integrase
VQRALVRVGGKVEIGTTKTTASRRELRLPTAAARALDEHRSRQAVQRAAVREHWQDRGLVFQTGLGTLLRSANLRRGLRQVTEAAGLGRWHPDELRHSAVSVLSAAGVPLEDVADVLGHTSTRVTSSVHRHRTTPTVEAAVAPMNPLFDRPDDQ